VNEHMTTDASFTHSETFILTQTLYCNANKRKLDAHDQKKKHIRDRYCIFLRVKSSSGKKT